MLIQAAVTRKAGDDFAIEELELAEPHAGELLVRVMASGVCGTDEAARQQHAPVRLPAVLGHEGAGIIERVGAGITQFKAGDHVCFSFNSCGSCEFCESGKPYRCESSGELNFAGVYLDRTRRLSKGNEEFTAFFGQSSFATYAVVSERGAIKINQSIPFEIAAPMGCGIQTGAGTVFNVLAPSFGQSLAIFGMGTVGFSALMAGHILGLDPLIAVGGNTKTLELAARLGATHTINRKEVASEEIPAAIRQITGKGAHYTIDTSGAAPLVKAAINSLRPDGTIAVMAPSEPITIDLFTDFIDNTRRLVGVMEGAAVPQLIIPRLLDYYQAGRFPINELITTYDFANINQAFKDSSSGQAIKAVLMMNSTED